MNAIPNAEAFDALGDRLFAFYPPIIGVDHNEWRFKKIEWSESLVENPASGVEIWVPRTWLGEISRVEEPLLIVGLKRELQYKAGSLVPYQRKVVGMPRVHSAAPVPELPRPRFTDELRGTTGPEGNLAKGLLGALAVALVLITAAVGLSRWRSAGGQIRYETREQRDLTFNAETSYLDIVGKLGSPEEDRWRPNGGERRFRALEYKKEGLVLILMGPEQNDSVRYIGAKDSAWKTVHYIDLPGGRSTRATIDNLPRF
jgi:hypothetical protein